MPIPSQSYGRTKTTWMAGKAWIYFDRTIGGDCSHCHTGFTYRDVSQGRNLGLRGDWPDWKDPSYHIPVSESRIVQPSGLIVLGDAPVYSGSTLTSSGILDQDRRQLSGRLAFGLFYRNEHEHVFFSSLNISEESTEYYAVGFHAMKRRHRAKQSMGFADGHVEIKSIPKFNDLGIKSIR